LTGQKGIKRAKYFLSVGLYKVNWDSIVDLVFKMEFDI